MTLSCHTASHKEKTDIGNERLLSGVGPSCTNYQFTF